MCRNHRQNQRSAVSCQPADKTPAHGVTRSAHTGSHRTVRWQPEQDPDNFGVASQTRRDPNAPERIASLQAPSQECRSDNCNKARPETHQNLIHTLQRPPPHTEAPTGAPTNRFIGNPAPHSCSPEQEQRRRNSLLLRDTIPAVSLQRSVFSDQSSDRTLTAQLVFRRLTADP